MRQLRSRKCSLEGLDEKKTELEGAVSMLRTEAARLKGQVTELIIQTGTFET